CFELCLHVRPFDSLVPLYVLLKALFQYLQKFVALCRCQCFLALSHLIEFCLETYFYVLLCISMCPMWFKDSNSLSRRLPSCNEFSLPGTEIPRHYRQHDQQCRPEQFISRAGRDMRKHGPEHREEETGVRPFLEYRKAWNKHHDHTQNLEYAKQCHQVGGIAQPGKHVLLFLNAHQLNDSS